MSATLKLISHVIVDIDGKPYQAGSLTQARTIALGSDLPYEMVFSVPPSTPTTAVKLFDIAENLADFDFLLIETDLTVLLQFATNGATEYDVKELLGSGTANSYGIPFLLGSDDTQQQDGTIDLFDGTADTIEQIYAYNESATDTARVHILAAT